jgi:hypothetical protein
MFGSNADCRATEEEEVEEEEEEEEKEVEEEEEALTNLFSCSSFLHLFYHFPLFILQINV